MAVSSNTLNARGNQIVADGLSINYDAQTGAEFTAAAGHQPSITAGLGAPTFTAKQGSMYIRVDGGVNTRVYINTNGATTWTPLTNAA